MKGFVALSATCISLLTIVPATVGATEAAAVASAWDSMVANEPPESLQRFTDLERQVLDALSPAAAESFLRGVDPSQIQTLGGGEIASVLEQAASAGGSEPLRFVPVEPCRVADSRLVGRKFSDNEIRYYVVRGETTDYSPQGGNPNGCGILGLSEAVTLANSARAVLFNFRVDAADGSGNLRAWPSNRPQITVPLQNYRKFSPALKMNNVAIVPLCDEVSIDPCPFGDIKARLTRSAHLIVEVHGYFVPAVSGVAAGPGLVGGGSEGSVALEVDFAGNGGEDTAARSDHVHAESVPPGAIVMWSGSLADIPTGWALCDGTNGTPDLRDRFVLGAAIGEEPGGVGGAHSYSLMEDQLAAHGHGLSIDTGGTHAHAFTRVRSEQTIAAAVNPWAAQIPWNISLAETVATHPNGAHAHGGAALATGLGAPIDNRPAFFKLAFLIKL